MLHKGGNARLVIDKGNALVGVVSFAIHSVTKHLGRRFFRPTKGDLRDPRGKLHQGSYNEAGKLVKAVLALLGIAANAEVRLASAVEAVALFGDAPLKH